MRDSSHHRTNRTIELFAKAIPKIRRHLRPIVRKVLAGPGVFAERYGVEDNSRVVMYVDDDSLLVDYAPRRPLTRGSGQQSVQVSLIASAKNEAKTVGQWTKSILSQTRLPDEIIVVDAGSTDGTLERLKTLAQGTVPVQVIVEPDANIARARNIAIAHARSPVIAVTDFGCRPRPDWLAKIVAPFELETGTQVAMGMYDPTDRKARSLGNTGLWLRIENINPQNFLPSSRSIAFTKKAWETVGGYPEWLTLTGEDTCFDLELKRAGGEWAFVPGAMVEWSAPDSFFSYLQRMYTWSIGDGESGVHAPFYWRYVLQLGAWSILTVALLLLAGTSLVWSIRPIEFWAGLCVLIWLGSLSLVARRARVSPGVFLQKITAELVQVIGFLKGARRQSAVAEKRLGLVRGTFFILSGVPIDDTGGGARCTQLALELLRQSFAVVFINKFPKYENKELNLKISHPNLFIFSLAEFQWQNLFQGVEQSLEGKLLAGIVEFPLKDFLPLIECIRKRGGAIVYDLLDAWDTLLGGQWYSPSVEMEIVQASQVLVATVPSLAARLEQVSGRNVVLLPNAVNRRLFDPERHYPRPADLPIAEWTAIYTGALWGEWFDWDLLEKIAGHYPEAGFILIGDYREPRRLPPNVHVLGLKPQKELPAYLAHADVAMVPWKINAVTNSTSPLKVYEYLAMHRPVVAPDINPLRGMPGVFLAANAQEFTTKLAEARTAQMPELQVDRFIRENSWQTRVKTLLALVQNSINYVQTKE